MENLNTNDPLNTQDSAQPENSSLANMPGSVNPLPSTPQPKPEPLPDLAPPTASSDTIRSVQAIDSSLQPVSFNSTNFNPAPPQPELAAQPSSQFAPAQPVTNPWANNSPSTPQPPQPANDGFIRAENNPQPPTLDLNSVVTPENPLGVGGQPPQEISSNSGGNEDNVLHKITISKPILLVVIASILILGLGGFTLNEFVLNKISSLSLISEDAQFYLSLAVKKNSQAEQAKALVKKFPGGERLLKEFDKYYANYIGDEKDPLVDITYSANTELLLARISRADGKTDTSNRLFSIVDADSTKSAKEDLANFEDDVSTYKTTSSDYKGNKVIDIKLKSEQELYESQLKRDSTLSRSISTPKAKSLFATNIEKFIVASDKETDVQKAVTLSQTRKFLGFSKDGDAKSILDSSDHKSLASNFQKETFLKYFQRDPITPYNSFLPFYNFGGVSTYPQASETEAKTYQKISRALDTFVNNEGARVNSYQLDIPNIKQEVSDFKIDNSLASKLPKQYSKVSPTSYSETRNLLEQWNYQKKLAAEMKNSKNRNQREAFERYLEGMEESKKSTKANYGIDYEEDILSWMDGQVATIFNAGAAKKSPELLVVAEIKDKSKVENSLKKLSIPDYSVKTNDAKRQSDLHSLESALRLYYYDNDRYPDSLTVLESNKNYLYLRKLPKDPTSGQDYSYTVDGDKQNFTLSTKLQNGQTLTITADDEKFSGEEKDSNLKPTPTKYKNTNLYQMKIYEFNKLSWSIFFAVTDSKAIFGISDTDQSFKDVIDFEGSKGDTITKTLAWKKQFEKTNGAIGGLSFIEPINLWGFMEYLKSNYPEYSETVSNTYGAKNDTLNQIEKVVKGYLRTIPSIGTVLTKKKDVVVSSTFINIVELSKNDKKEAEDALAKLIQFDEKTKYKSVLGVNTTDAGKRFQKDWNNFYQNTLKKIIDPQDSWTN